MKINYFLICYALNCCLLPHLEAAQLTKSLKLPIENQLPSKGLYTPDMEPDKQCLFSCNYQPQRDKALTLSLDNGFKMIVPLHEDQYLSQDRLRLIEQDILIKKPDGTIRVVYAVGAWGEPHDLFINTKQGQVTIDQLITFQEGAQIKEHRAHTLFLKCSKDDCGFFWHETCLLDFKQYDGPVFHSEDDSTIRQSFKEVLIFGGIEGLLKVALAGNKNAYDLFLDVDYLDNYFHFDGYIAEIYHLYSEFLVDYYQKCPERLSK